MSSPQDNGYDVPDAVVEEVIDPQVAVKIHFSNRTLVQQINDLEEQIKRCKRSNPKSADGKIARSRIPEFEQKLNALKLELEDQKKVHAQSKGHRRSFRPKSRYTRFGSGKLGERFFPIR